MICQNAYCVYVFKNSKIFFRHYSDTFPKMPYFLLFFQHLFFLQKCSQNTDIRIITNLLIYFHFYIHFTYISHTLKKTYMYVCDYELLFIQINNNSFLHIIHIHFTYFIIRKYVYAIINFYS